MDYIKITTQMDKVDSLIMQLYHTRGVVNTTLDSIKELKLTSLREHFKLSDLFKSNIRKVLRERVAKKQAILEEHVDNTMQASLAIAEYLEEVYIDFVKDVICQLYGSYDLGTQDLEKSKMEVLTNDAVAATENYKDYLVHAIKVNSNFKHMYETKPAFERVLDRYLRHYEFISLNTRTMLAVSRLY